MRFESHSLFIDVLACIWGRGKNFEKIWIKLRKKMQNTKYAF